MTDEERVREIAEHAGIDLDDFDLFIEEVSIVFAAIRAEEREACAALCERRAWQIAGLDGSEMDAAYNQGWRDGAERVAHAIAAIRSRRDGCTLS